ncbi:MAG: ABC transporter ATP-binding protein [Candidatus Bathyarchaeia archaeon]
MLEVNQLNVSYGELQVLFDVSLMVKKGELVALLGPNGAGKTTFTKAVIGLLKPKSGSIFFLGKRIENLPTPDITKMGIAIVPEGRRLFPLMTVKENLLIGAYVSKEARTKAKDTLNKVYTLFPRLKERENQLAKTLSGGEQQMLAIGRALMSLPKLLILDEPSLGLAPSLVLTMLNTIKKLNEGEKLTILLIEQNVRAALQIADRGYVIENGRVVLEGEAKEMLKEEYIKKAYMGGD